MTFGPEGSENVFGSSTFGTFRIAIVVQSFKPLVKSSCKVIGACERTRFENASPTRSIGPRFVPGSSEGTGGYAGPEGPGSTIAATNSAPTVRNAKTDAVCPGLDDDLPGFFFLVLFF